jgi:serine protease Do
MTIQEIGRELSEIAGTIGNSVAGVGSRRSQGSAVVIAEGRLLTNAHNLGGDGPTAVFVGGERREGEVVGADPDADLAVISVDTSGLEPAPWADAIPGIGSAAIAVANPAGRGLRVTLGYVSGIDRTFRGPRGRRIGGGIEHTAPLLPGSSGGALVDPDGRLVGINTHRLGSGFYLAIPTDAALKERVDRLAKGEASRRHRLGVGLVPPEMSGRLRRAVGLADRDGLLVRWVEDDSPAAKAGMRQGDLIVTAGPHSITGLDELQQAIDEADDMLVLSIVRGTEELTVTAAFEPDGQ